MAAVQKLASQFPPATCHRVLPTSISDDGWPADQVDMMGKVGVNTRAADSSPIGNAQRRRGVHAGGGTQ